MDNQPDTKGLFKKDPYGKRVTLFPGNLSLQRPGLLVRKDGQYSYIVAYLSDEFKEVVTDRFPKHQIVYGW